MTRLAAPVIVLCAIVLLASPASAQEFTVDKALATAGKSVWSAKGCNGCHTIGKGKFAAPDLDGLYARRTIEWVKTWLKNPAGMFESDEAAKAMLKEWNGLKMPDMKLTDAEIDAVMHYIGEQQKTKTKK